MAGLRAAYTYRFRGPRTHYRGVLLDEHGHRVWTCEHRHPASVKSPKPGPRSGAVVFTSALDCAREELGRRAEGVMHAR